MLKHSMRFGGHFAILGAALAISACSSSTTPPSQASTIAYATSSGNGQSAAAGVALAAPLRVVVTNAGAPQAGVAVTWATASGGGTLAPATSSTDATGNATSVWTLGSAVGAQTATVTLAGAIGSPLPFSATATGSAPMAATVDVQNNVFVPSTTTIRAGGTVTWNWSGNNHNVSPKASQPTRSGPLAAAGTTYSFTFTTPGTYIYFCEAHGTSTPSGMFGTITVQ